MTGTADKYHQVASPANSTSVPVSTAESFDMSDPVPPRLASFAQLFHFADSTDYVLMAVGSIAAIATGLTDSIQMVLLGNVINAFIKPQESTSEVPFDRDAFQRGINRVSVQIVILAAVVFVCGLLQIACWSITSSRQAKKIRHALASAILRQDVAWFDTIDPMELATRVAHTTLLVQEGIGRKVGDALNFISIGVMGFGLAFYYGWQLSLVLLAFVPLMTISSYCMTKAVTAAVQSGAKGYAHAGGIAQESLSNVKIVHVLNTLHAAVDKYSAALNDSQAAGIRKGRAVGIGIGIDFFILFSTYAAAMYYSATLLPVVCSLESVLRQRPHHHSIFLRRHRRKCLWTPGPDSRSHYNSSIGGV
ncbi:hypothetical protein H310_08644 [Aphanomyces invadans]|uniref:ABC transmembrane type-1 domain-containing protein n=1 Tax=Aphanomyces invadans TaxID=157072 RepID=A0A024TWH8_9STRA|nr:hypothetical protein H310_08644 [Aphanomyces invadans]ETV98505.1 hypothetical protein H310_08644 [Aphanomyces invadans]|eukprot:XP_008872702.1 hypothetical protein H310_08644 [Aphanomyces invadans]